MLIKSLCDYYDMLAEKGKTASNGYEYVEITHTVFLKEDGTISSISDCRKASEYTDKKGKTKVKYEPKQVLFPKRISSTSVSSEFIEHRRQYIFGLAFDNGELHTWKLKSGKKQDILKYFRKFKEDNLKFIEGIDSPIVNAYRGFILNWNPENELENEHLLPLGKDFENAKFEFRLVGDEKLPSLQDDEQIKRRWETQYFNNNENSSDKIESQCGIYGEKEEIARTHAKIKNLDGGQSTGCSLVCFNNEADESYGKMKSYNSNISVRAMRKYTEALNYLIEKNKMMVGDINTIYWSCDKDSGEKCEKMFDDFLECKFDDKMESEDSEKFLKKLVNEAKSGKINFDKISDDVVREMDENADFYIVGLKPNKTRIAIKFFYKNKFGKLMYNIAKHQRDIQISSKEELVPLWKIKLSMIPEKSKKAEINPEIMSQIFKTIIYGGRYPELLLNTAIRRFKLARLKDDDKKSKEIYSSNQKLRAGLIKACLTRKSKNKEEFKMSLDLDNKNAAYLCGRLFAVLEKIQQDSASKELNRTIKDSYFSSACSRPSSVFPQILKLSSHHLAKLDDKSKIIYYNKLISSIIDNINGEFPNHLYLDDQGRFIIGYYQQNNALYTSKAKKEDNENMNINEFEEED